MIRTTHEAQTATALRDLDDTGWVVAYPDGHRLHYPDSGGAWILDARGCLGRQVEGTCQVRAPRKRAQMRRLLRALMEWPR